MGLLTVSEEARWTTKTLKSSDWVSGIFLINPISYSYIHCVPLCCSLGGLFGK
jgi:hypothetical protein